MQAYDSLKPFSKASFTSKFMLFSWMACPWVALTSLTLTPLQELFPVPSSLSCVAHLTLRRCSVLLRNYRKRKSAPIEYEPQGQFMKSGDGSFNFAASHPRKDKLRTARCPHQKILPTC